MKFRSAPKSKLVINILPGSAAGVKKWSIAVGSQFPSGSDPGTIPRGAAAKDRIALGH